MSNFIDQDDRQKAVNTRLGELVAQLHLDSGEVIAGAVLAIQWAPTRGISEEGKATIEADRTFGVAFQPALSKQVHIRILSSIQSAMSSAILSIKTQLNTVLMKDREKTH